MDIDHRRLFGAWPGDGLSTGPTTQGQPHPAGQAAELLQKIKEDLQKSAGVVVETWPVDLSDPDQVKNAMDLILAEGKLDAAILNAGVTHFGPHREMTGADFDRLIQVNVKSVVYVTTRLVDYFERRDAATGAGASAASATANAATATAPAAIMLVSSMAAFLSTPYQAAYSGTKAFLLNFADALRFELKKPDLSITVFAPGGIATEMTEGQKFDALRTWLMPVDAAAAVAIKAFKHRKRLAIPGLANKAGWFLSRILPRWFMTRQLGKTYGKALDRTNTRVENPGLLK